jgi:hypothetical protein
LDFLKFDVGGSFKNVFEEARDGEIHLCEWRLRLAAFDRRVHFRHSSWFVSVDEDRNHDDEDGCFILLQFTVK